MGFFSSVNSSISIHALREEGDPDLVKGTQQQMEISIHALREEGDRRQARTFS